MQDWSPYAQSNLRWALSIRTECPHVFRPRWRPHTYLHTQWIQLLHDEFDIYTIYTMNLIYTIKPNEASHYCLRHLREKLFETRLKPLRVTPENTPNTNWCPTRQWGWEPHNSESIEMTFAHRGYQKKYYRLINLSVNNPMNTEDGNLTTMSPLRQHWTHTKKYQIRPQRLLNNPLR